MGPEMARAGAQQAARHHPARTCWGTRLLVGPASWSSSVPRTKHHRDLVNWVGW